MTLPKFHLVLPYVPNAQAFTWNGETAESLKELGRILAQHGYESTGVALNHPEAYRSLLARLQESHPHQIFITGPKNFELGLGDGQESVFSNLFKIFGKPVYGFLSDNPATHFMFRRLRQTPPTVRLLYQCASYRQQVGDLYPWLADSLAPLPNMLSHFAESAAAPERDIEILFPLSLARPVGQWDLQAIIAGARRIEQPLGDVFAAAAAELGERLDMSAYDALRRAFAERFDQAVLPQRYPAGRVQEILFLLDQLDYLNRHGWRKRALQSVARAAGAAGLTVTVTQDADRAPADLGAHVRFIGAQAPTRLRELITRSQTIVSLMCSYPHDLDPRVLDGAAGGAAVLTEAKPANAALLTHGETAALTDSADRAGDVLMDTLWPNRAAIAERGQALVTQRFTPSAWVEQFLDTCRAFGDIP